MNCPVCSSQTRHYGISNKGAPGRAGDVALSKCLNCGLIFMPEALTIQEDALREYYQGELSWEQYRARRIQEMITGWNTYQFYADFFQKYVAKDKSVLDIGCGCGEFMFVLKQRGYQNILGTEYSVKALRFCNGIMGIPATNTDGSHEKKDAVTLLQVIEHEPRPDVMLAKIRDSLTPQGKLMIATPDADCILSRLWEIHWHLINRHHVMLHTAQSLTRVLNKAGFKVIALKRGAYYSDKWYRSYASYLLSFGIAVLKCSLIPTSSNADGKVLMAEKLVSD